LKGIISGIFIAVIFVVSFSGFQLAKACEGKDAKSEGITLAEESQESGGDMEDSDQAEESDDEAYDDYDDIEDGGSSEEEQQQPYENDEPAETEQPSGI